MKIKEIIRSTITFAIVGILLVAIWKIGSMDEINPKTNNSGLDEDSESFLIDMADYIKGIDKASSLTVAKSDISAEMMDLSKYYNNGSLTDYTMRDLLLILADNNIRTTSDLINALTEEIDRIQTEAENIVNPDLSQARQVSLKTTTACQTYGDETMYCLKSDDEDLNGYVFNINPNSKKWVILLHGNTGNGKSIFNSIGDIYTENGYNVLAPDLRASGLSGGISSWGYVDSLDVYDWVKWLNSNYDVDTLVIHGVSLGAAVGLQLTTSPDYSDALRNKYHFKGLVDDSGYTSLPELVKGIINGAEAADNGDLFENLGRNADSVVDAIGDYINDGGLEDLISGGIKFEGLDDFINQYVNPNANTNPRIDENAITPQVYKNDSVKVEKLTEHYDVIPDGEQYTMDSSMARFLKEVIIEAPQFGMTSVNYDTYADSFAGNRNFKSQDNVLVIHSETDDVIDPVNATRTYNKAKEANTNFRFLWGLENQPHAFILVGIKKNEYYGLVRDYLACIESNTCKEEEFHHRFNNW